MKIRSKSSIPASSCNRRSILRRKALTVLVAACGSAASVAQETPVNDGAISEIAVTGSRIVRPDLESTMPVNVVDFDQVQGFGRFTVYDALMLNPAVAPGLGDFNSGGQEFDKGAANIDLRNMGVNRSLVLVDGHRWVSGGARTAAVDMNTIPSALIDRIETVTGGAAAIYGADAVTGAVNVIMKKQMDGVSFSATTGVSEEGDARQSNFSLATGWDIGDNAHFVIGGNYTDTEPVMVIDRYTDRRAYYLNPDNTGPNDGIPDNIVIDYNQFYRSHYPTFCIHEGEGRCGSARDGDWYQVINGDVVNIPKDSYRVMSPGDTGIQEGGPADTGFGIFDNLFMRDESEKGSIYANLNVELTPEITWNTSLGWAHSYVSGVAQWPEYRDDARPTNWWGINPETGVGHPGGVATFDDPYLPDDLRSFMLDNSLDEVRLNRHYFNLPAPLEQHTRNSFTLGTDLTGPLTRELNWEAFARYGQVKDDIDTINMVGRQQWLYSRDSIEQDGEIVCADPEARAAGCVPFNLYTLEQTSQEWNDYALFERDEMTRNRMFNMGLGINGSVFSLPHGDVMMAAGLEWRREELTTRDEPDKDKLSNIVWAPGNDHGLHPDMDVSRKTTEAYAEVMVPLLQGVPFVEKLEVEAAYRYSDYSDNPTTDTWKAGLIWKPYADLTLRGVKSYSTRVPNFGELYSPVSVVTLGHIGDPCQAQRITQDDDRAANCAATIPGWTGPLPNPNVNAPRVFSGGNENLTPESSDSYSYGLVWEPSFVEGFDFTADYWEIEIEDVITSLSYGTIMNNCVNPSDGPNLAYCQFVHRFTETTEHHNLGEVDWIQAQYANLAGRLTRGIDFGAHYRFNLGPGTALLGFSGTRLLEQRVVAQVGSAGNDVAGKWDHPDFRGNLMAHYDWGQFSIGLNTGYRSRSEYSTTDQSSETREYPEVASYVKHDLTLGWRPNERFNLSLGVKNLTDARLGHPVLAQNTGTSPHKLEGNGSANAHFDAIGRYFFVTLKAQL